MDPGVLALLIPIVALLCGTAVKITSMKNAHRRSGMSEDAVARLDALEGDVDHLRQQLSETQERVDFAERLLAQAAEARALGSEQKSRQ